MWCPVTVRFGEEPGGNQRNLSIWPLEADQEIPTLDPTKTGP